MSLCKLVLVSHHAEKRCRDRGIPDRILQLIHSYADVSKPVGGRATADRISAAAVAALVAEGVAPDDARRAARIAAIMNDEGRIITVLRPRPGHRGRPYRVGR